MTASSKSCLHEIIQASTGLSTSSQTSYLKTIDSWIAFAGEAPANWTQAKAQAFYDNLCAKAAGATALKMLSALRYASRGYAKAGQGLDFAIGVVPKSETKPIKLASVLTMGQVTALFEVMMSGTRPSTLRDRAVLALAIGTGMRRTSLAALPIRPWTYDKTAKCAIMEAPLKTGRTWKVPVAPLVVKLIQPYEQWLGQSRATTGMFFRKIVKTIDGYQPGNSFAADGWAIWAIVEAIGARVGLPITPDSLRQTLIAWLHAAGTDPRIITTITGQRDPEDRTQDTDYDSLRHRAAEAVDNVLRPVIL